MTRFRYWAYFTGGDPERQVRVEYDIPGAGNGFYLRQVGDRPRALLRYDAEGGAGAGARLGEDGQWHPAEGPVRNVLLGSDYGDPVGEQEAREIVVALGHPPEVLDRPTVVPGSG